LEDGENRVVVGTLDLNQCHSLADELIGKRPQVFCLFDFYSAFS